MVQLAQLALFVVGLALLAAPGALSASSYLGCTVEVRLLEHPGEAVWNKDESVHVRLLNFQVVKVLKEQGHSGPNCSMMVADRSFEAKVKSKTIERLGDLKKGSKTTLEYEFVTNMRREGGIVRYENWKAP